MSYESFQIIHIGTKSINIWLRYDPEWNITSCLCGSMETRSDFLKSEYETERILHMRI